MALAPATLASWLAALRGGLPLHAMPGESMRTQAWILQPKFPGVAFTALL